MTRTELHALKASLVETPVKAYTPAELARLYFPQSAERTAYRRLNRWIGRNEQLKAALVALSPRSQRFRVYTPSMVAAIFDALGEP